MHARLKILLPMLLVAATVVLYWPSLHYAPFFDDTNLFERGGLQHVFLDGFAFSPRWLPYFVTAWVDLIFEDPLFAQRCLNVGLHLATAFVLYGLIRQVSDHAAPHPNNKRAALAATLLFLLHPLAVYAVGYLIQRTILMATLFGLLTLSAYFDGLVTRRKAYFFFSALFYLLSSFSKEHAVLIPAAALALTPLAESVTHHTWRRLVLPLSLFASIAILVTLKSLGILGQVYEPFAAPLLLLRVEESDPLLIWFMSIMTQASLFFKYLGLMLIPYPGWMSIDMRVPFAAHIFEPKYVLGLLAFVGYGMVALSWLLRGGRRGLIGFALLAPWLLFGVEFSAVRIQEPFVLYRSYLWLAPLFLFVPAVSYALPDKLFWPIILVVALAFTYASSDRLKSFSSGYVLWDDAVRKLPHERELGAARAHSNRGNWNARRGDLHAAIADYTRALGADPGFKDAYRGRASAYMKLGDHYAALRDANAIVRLYPKDPGGFTLRGVIYRSKGDVSLAIADFEHACEQKSDGACVALGVTKGRYSTPGPRQ